MKTNNQRLFPSIENIGNGVIITYLEGKVLFLNHVTESLIGCKYNEVMGKPIEVVFNFFNNQTKMSVENYIEHVYLENFRLYQIPESRCYNKLKLQFVCGKMF